MTISNTARKAGPFAGNGVVTAFPFAFKVFASTDISLVRLNADSSTTTLILDSDYSVALNPDQNSAPGGTITYPRVGSGGVPLPEGETLTAVGVLPNLQPADITNSGGFYPSVNEDSFDRATIQIQQVAEDLSRALVFPITDATPSVVLPAAAARIGKTIVFDENGNVAVSIDNYVDQAAASAGNADAALAAQEAAQTARQGAETAQSGAQTIATKFGDVDGAITAAQASQSAALGSANDSLGSANTAAARAAAAAASLAAALPLAGAFDSTADGIAGTTSGKAFGVLSPTNGRAFDLYANAAGTATPSGKWIVDGKAVVATLGMDVTVAEVVKFGDETIGTAAAGNNLSVGSLSSTPAYGIIDSVIVRTGGVGTGEIHVYSPVDGETAYVVTSITAVTLAIGTNTFQGLWPAPVPQGSFVCYRSITGNGTFGGAVAGGPGAIVATNTGQVVGSPVIGLHTTTNSYSVAFNFIDTSSSIGSRLDTAEAGRDEFGSEVIAYLGSDFSDNALSSFGTTTPNTSTNASTFTYGGPPVAKTSVLRSVTVRAQMGPAAIMIYEPIAGSTLFTVAAIIPVIAAVTGLNTFDMGDRLVTVGSQIHFAGGIQFDVGGVGGFIVSPPAPTTTGGTVTIAPYANTLAISYELLASPNSVETRLVTLESQIGSSNVTAEDIRGPVTLVETRFPGVDLPVGWVNNGGWTVANGILTPTSAGWNVSALEPNYSSLAFRTIRSRHVVSAATDVFGFCTFPPVPAQLGGTAVIVDGAAGMLSLYAWQGSAAGTLSSQVALPGPLVPGQVITITAVKNGLGATITFEDATTFASCTLTETLNAQYAQFHGRHGLINVAGAAQCLGFRASANSPRIADVSLVGDSIEEGANLPLNSPTYPYQLAADLGPGRVVIAPRAGDTTTAFLLRKSEDLDIWKSRYVFLALGTNDTSQTVWRANMATIISTILANGGTPILPTQAPRDSAQALRSAMNADILGNFFGVFPVVDFASCLTLNHDRVTWNPGFTLGDGTHPNYPGQLEMYKQLRVDAPFLWG